jgi:hypothetical protein
LDFKNFQSLLKEIIYKINMLIFIYPKRVPILRKMPKKNRLRKWVATASALALTLGATSQKTHSAVPNNPRVTQSSAQKEAYTLTFLNPLLAYYNSLQNPPPLPTEYYVSETRQGTQFPLTLDQVIETEKTDERDTLLPEFIRISPKGADPKSWKRVVVYSTAIGNARDPKALTDENGKPNTWCLPCNAFAEEKTPERIERGTSEIPGTGFIEIFHPPSKNIPSYLKVCKGVPKGRIYEIRDGSLFNVVQVTAPSIKAYAEEAIRAARLQADGKLREIVIAREGFRGIETHYDTTSETDCFALAMAGALFPEKVSGDLQTVTLDLSDSQQFRFFLNTNPSDSLMPDEGRNISQSISNRIIGYGVEAQDVNLSAWVNARAVDYLLRVRSENPDSFMYQLRHKLAFESFSAFSQGFVPPYIFEDYKKFVAQGQAEFLGTANSYTVITDLTSPGTMQTLEEWAEKNQKQLEKRSLQGRGNPNIAKTIERINEALSYLDEIGVEYCRSAPRSVLEQLAQRTPYTVVAISHRPFLEDVREIETYLRDPGLGNKYTLSLSTLMAIAETESDRKKVTCIALPYVNTRLGFTDAPHSCVTRFGDGYGGDPDTPTLLLLEKGKPPFAPFRMSSWEAVSTILERIK